MIKKISLSILIIFISCFIGISLVKADTAICVYKDATYAESIGYREFTFTLNHDEKTISVEYSGTQHIEKANFPKSLGLTIADFINPNGKLYCPDSVHVNWLGAGGTYKWHFYFSLSQDKKVNEVDYGERDFPINSSKSSVTETKAPSENESDPSNETGGETETKKLSGAFDFCNPDTSNGVLQALKFVGILLFIIKIIVPILIIAFGSIDFAKAIISNSEDTIKKSATAFIMRIIAGIAVFFVPTIINAIFNMIDDYTANASQFTNCTTCLFSPSDCQSK